MSKSKRALSLIMAIVLVLGAVVAVKSEEAYAETGTTRDPLTSATCTQIITTFGGYENNFLFRADDTGETLQGYCLEASKESTIQVGWKANASEITGKLRVLMYLAYTKGYTASNNPWNYIVARCSDSINRGLSSYQANASSTMANGQALFEEVMATDESTVPLGFKAYRLSYNANRQDVITYRYEIVPGYVQITKASANTSMTNGNSCYSFSGAIFGVYATQAEANAATDANRGNPVAVLTTGSDGKTPISDLIDPGTYYVKELVAPQGFLINNSVHPVTIPEGATGFVTIADEPLSDPNMIRIYKRSASGSALITTSSAVFKVEFYPNTNWSGTPQRTWYFKTIDGQTRLSNANYLDTSYTNSELWTDGGFVTYPLGSLRITEVAAPDGYVSFGSSFELKATITVNSEGDAELNWTSPTTTGQLYYETDGTPSVLNESLYGGVKFTKIDAPLGGSTPSGNASLAGAVITIYNNSGAAITLKNGTTVANGAAVMTVTTDASGSAQTAADALPYGTYYAVETTAPTGYAINSSWRADFTITENGTIVNATPNLGDSPITGGAGVAKTAAEGVQGDVSLAGVKFAVVNKSTNSVKVGSTTVASGAVAAIITTDASGSASTANNTLPYGTYTVYELRADATIAVGETYSGSSKLGSSALANDGGLLYTNNNADVTITTNGTIITVEFADNILYGGVKITKQDADLDASTPQGDASLAGIVFEIVNKSAAAVTVNGTSYAVNAVITTITTAADGTASTTAILPFGTYEIREKTTNTSYNLTDTAARTFQIRESGTIVDATYGNEFQNEVIRGGVKFQKVDAVTKTAVPYGPASLAGAEITIYNNSANSVVVGGTEYAKGAAVMTVTTDAEGKASTAANALPYGTFYAVETAASPGYELNTTWRANFTIRENGVIVDTTVDYILEEERTPIEVGTTALDGASGEHVGAAAGADTITIVDTVVMKGLLPSKTYTLIARLVDKKASTETTQVFIGSPVTKEFTTPADLTTADEYSVDVEITVDAAVLNGKTTVVFETLQYEGVELAIHADLTDEDQTVEYPGPTVHTTATDEYTEDHEGVTNTATVTIVDEVVMTGLIAGKEYTLTGRLVDKDESTEDEPVYIGEPVIKKFTVPDTVKPADEYTVTLEFTVDQELLRGKTTVVFEDLMSGDKSIAIHADLTDADQTVEYTVPEVKTTALDIDSDDHTAYAADETVSVIDTVVLTGLKADTEYKLHAQVVNKDESTDEKPFVIGEADVTFTTPADLKIDDEYSVEVEVELKLEDVLGVTTVCFETLYHDDVEIAIHADLEDDNQTVEYEIPEIHTNAIDKDTGEQNTIATGETVTIVDTVTMKGLKADTEYTLHAEVVDKTNSTDDETVVIAETDLTFTTPDDLAYGAEYAVEVEIEIPAEKVMGKTTVCFETLLKDDIEIAIHADLTDEDQTVKYGVPELKTTALDKGTEDHIGYVDGTKVTIIDTVKITDIKGGEEYTVTGKLIDKDASTDGKIVYIEGVEETITFKTEVDETSKTVTMIFVVDAEKVVGKSVVVAETLILGDYVLAVHDNPEDADQTVEYPAPEIGTTATNEKGGKEVHADKKGVGVVVDTIAVKNVKPGTVVMAKGILMNKETGEVLTAEDGTTYEAVSEPVTITGEEDTVEVKFVIENVKQFVDIEVVVFEKLYVATITTETDEEGNATEKGELTDILLAFHEDIEDEAQAVFITEAPDTGDHANIFRYSVIFVGAIAGLCLMTLNKKRKESEE